MYIKFNKTAPFELYHKWLIFKPDILMDLWHWDTSLVDQFNSKNSINFKSVCSWYGHHNNKLLFLHTITSPHPSPCSAVGISFSVNAAHYTTVHSLNMHMHTLATALSEPLLQTNQLVLRKSDWLRGGKELTAKTPKCNVLAGQTDDWVLLSVTRHVKAGLPLPPDSLFPNPKQVTSTMDFYSLHLYGVYD